MYEFCHTFSKTIKYYKNQREDRTVIECLERLEQKLKTELDDTIGDPVMHCLKVLYDIQRFDGNAKEFEFSAFPMPDIITGWSPSDICQEAS